MKKRILLLIIILLIIVILVVIGVIMNLDSELTPKQKKQLKIEHELYLNGINNPGLIIEGAMPEEVLRDNTFFTTENCVKEYIKYVLENNFEAIYSLLDYKYINTNKITTENLGQYIQKYNEANYNKTIEMYQINGIEYYTYFVKHRLGENIIYFIVNKDIKSNSFSIIPINESEYQKKIKEPAKAFGSKEDTIQMNEFNKVSYIYLKEIDVVRKYFNDYLEMALLNPEIAYNVLDEQYKTKKFGNLQEYKNHIENNKESYQQILNAGVNKYKVEEVNGNKSIICMDIYGNYYIFNTTSVMKYTVILDNYTIDLPECLKEI